MANRHVTFETTRGSFRIELMEDEAPGATESFTELVEEGTFDQAVFLRVVPDFLLELGRPDGGDGESPDYPIDPESDRRGTPDELLENDPAPEPHESWEGTVSMTDVGPGAAGPNLYVTLGASPWMDERHTILGRVVEGMDLLREIARLETDEDDRPTTDIVVRKAAVQSAS